MRFILLFLLLSISYAYADVTGVVRVVDMTRNTSAAIDDVTYCADVSNTSQSTKGTDRKCQVRDLFKAGDITIDGTNTGVGSTAPGAKVDVVGGIRVSGTVDTALTAGECVQTTTDGVLTTTGAACGSGGGGTGGWTDGGTTVSLTTSTDNVGIGTAASTSKLTVYGGGIQGELVDKTWESIAQPSGVNGTSFNEVNSMGIHHGKLYVGYDEDGGTPDDVIYAWDGNSLSYVNSLGSGSQFGGVTFLISYANNLYAGTQAAAIGGADVYVSTNDGVTFTKTYEDTTQHFSYSATVFKSKLYVGMGYSSSKILSFDGTTWAQVYAGKGGSGNGLVTDLYSYKGMLFASIGNGGLFGGIVSSPDGVTFTTELDGYTVTRFKEFRGKLYATTQAATPAPLFVRNDSTGTWSQVTTFASTGQCWGIETYNDALYVGCSASPRPLPGLIYKSYDGTNFSLDLTPVSGGLGYEPFRMTTYNGSLYVGYGGDVSVGAGAELWRKTDSLGSIFDNANEINKKIRFNTIGYNLPNDKSSLSVSLPFNFDSNVGIGTFDASNGRLIVTGGNVGIGSATPGATLDVNGSLAVRGNGNIAFSNGIILDADTTSLLGITGGNVGINSTNPNATLDITGTLRVSSTLDTALTAGECVQTTTNGVLTTTGSACGSGGGSGTVSSGTADRATIYDSAGTTVTSSTKIFDDNTNVGIGTIAPRSAVELGVQVLNIVGSNIGVGSITPGTKVDVNGTVRATAFSGPLTGNVTGNVSGTSGSTTGNAATATALAADPSACPGGDYVSDIAANGTLTCGTPTGSGTVNTGTAGMLTYYPASDTTVDNTTIFTNGTNIGIGTSLVTTAALSVMNGNIGIGTWVANSKLQIRQEANTILEGINVTNSATTGSSRLWNDTRGAARIDTAASSNDVVINGGGTGNLGIGTTVPQAKLSVLTSVAGDGFVITNTGATASTGGVGRTYRVNDGAAMGDGERLGYELVSGAVDSAGTLINAGAMQYFTEGAWSGTSAPVYMRFDTTPTGSLTRLERMRINQAGNVGIGTSAPIALLDVNRKLSVLSGGNIGVGSITPGSLLDIAGKTRTQTFQLTTSPSNGHVLTSDASGNGTWVASAAGSNYWNLGVGNVGVNTTNNVGIGSTNPEFALVVNGAAKIGSGTATVTGDSSGNIGIGTAGPRQKLEVAGAVRATGLQVGTTQVCLSDGTNCPAGGTGGWTDGTNVVTLTTGTDNVGIGTGAPVYDLEIKKTVAGLVGTGCTNLSAAGYCQMEVANSAGTAIGLIATGSGYAVPSVYGILVSAGEKFSFGEKDGTINMVILGDGNVGIGTVNPVEKFQVNGTIRPTGYKSSDGTTGVTVTTCTGFKNGLCISGT